MSIKPLVFSGTNYEIGFQQGKNCRENIQQAIQEVFALKPILATKPTLLPKPLFVILAKRKAEKTLKKDLFSQYPKQAERISGIANGAQVDISSLLFIQMLELTIAGCTSLGFFSRVTSTHETILAKNFDYANFSERYPLVCETQPKDAYRTLCCRLTPLAGALDGMNDRGLAMNYNLARSVDKPQSYAPTSIILQEMLETCKTAKEGVDFLTKAKTGGHDGIITLADSSDHIVTVELSREHFKIHEFHGDIVVNTNHYQTAEMKSIEVVPVYPSSQARFQRATQLLVNEKNVDVNSIKSVLSDHGLTKSASDETICMHGEWFGTWRSTIMFPKKKTMLLLFGHPCENEYQEIGFS